MSGGLAAASPLLAFVFVMPALNLGGITPFSGFVGKVALLEAGAQDGSVLAWLLVAGGVVTSLLTLYVVSRVWTLAFWRTRTDAPEHRCRTDAGGHAGADRGAHRRWAHADGAGRSDRRLQQSRGRRSAGP